MVLALCCLLTFAFLVVFVPCLFPRVFIVITNMRIDLEPWVLFWFGFFFLLLLLFLMTCCVDLHLDSLLPCEKE